MTVLNTQVLADLMCLIENSGPIAYISWDQLNALRDASLALPEYCMHNTKYGTTFSMRRSEVRKLVEPLVTKLVAESLEL